MARIIYAAGEYPRTGKDGGIIFSKYRNQNIIKAKTIPVIRYSELTNINRQKFASIVNNYKNISISNKNTFNNETSQYTRSNSYGFTYQLSGYNLYVSSGINIEKTGNKFLTSMASKMPPPLFSIISIDIDFGSSLINIQFNTGTIPANFDFYILASPVLPLNYKASSALLFRNIYFAGPGQSLPANFYDFYINKFGVISSFDNSQIFFRFELIQSDTGQVALSGQASSNDIFASGFPYTFPFTLS